MLFWLLVDDVLLVVVLLLMMLSMIVVVAGVVLVGVDVVQPLSFCLNMVVVVLLFLMFLL